MANFREIFDESDRELIAEAVSFYHKHAINQRNRHIDSANCKSLDKIKNWEKKEDAIQKILEKIIDESF